MKKMSNHEKHIMLWDELARTGGTSKRIAHESVKELKLMAPPSGYCFACEETIIDKIDYVFVDCDKCPITWTRDDDNDCCHYNSPYHCWDCSTTKKSRKKYAAIIRDLPWKDSRKERKGK